eukprot:COSAG02_NODE_6562_length_3494_cov_2.489838_3_plen_292_part_00
MYVLEYSTLLYSTEGGPASRPASACSTSAGALPCPALPLERRRPAGHWRTDDGPAAAAAAAAAAANTERGRGSQATTWRPAERHNHRNTTPHRRKRGRVRGRCLLGTPPTLPALLHVAHDALLASPLGQSSSLARRWAEPFGLSAMATVPGTCVAPQSQVPQNFNGNIISKVLGISSTEYCCDSCAREAKCVRWVYDPGLKECNILSTNGEPLIGGTFTSGQVSPGYDAPPIPNNWGLSLMVALGILTVVYLLGGMVRPACPVPRPSTSRAHSATERGGGGEREGEGGGRR